MLQSVQSTYASSIAIEPRDQSADAIRAIGRGCAAFPALGSTARAKRLGALIEAGAWTEAALALVQLQAPDWAVRRIAFDDGEWFCSLSRYPAMPAEFDYAAEGRHSLLPLAVLAALTDLQQQTTADRSPAPALGSGNELSAATAWFDNCA